MRKKTEKVLDELKGIKSNTEFLEENKDQFELLSIGEYIELEITNRKVKKQKIIDDSGISKRYFNQEFLKRILRTCQPTKTIFVQLYITESYRIRGKIWGGIRGVKI